MFNLFLIYFWLNLTQLDLFSNKRSKKITLMSFKRTKKSILDWKSWYLLTLLISFNLFLIYFQSFLIDFELFNLICTRINKFLSWQVKILLQSRIKNPIKIQFDYELICLKSSRPFNHLSLGGYIHALAQHTPYTMMRGI